MATKRTGLGRGIGALIPTSEPATARPVDVFFPASSKSGSMDASAQAASEGLQAIPGARLIEVDPHNVVPNRRQPRTNFDADDLASHRLIVDAIVADHGPIGTAVLAFGILGDQARAETDAAHAAAIAHTDYVAQVSLLTVLADAMRTAGAGSLVAFSSIAGVRARRANYVYGSAKAGLDAFCSGLTDALRGSGVRLLLVRPGFVVGRMTEGMSPAPLSSTPDEVADATVRALRRGRSTVWIPGSLVVLAFAFRLMPRWLWRRLPR